MNKFRFGTAGATLGLAATLACLPGLEASAAPSATPMNAATRYVAPEVDPAAPRVYSDSPSRSVGGEGASRGCVEKGAFDEIYPGLVQLVEREATKEMQTTFAALIKTDPDRVEPQLTTFAKKIKAFCRA